MGKSSGNPLQALLDFILSLFGSKKSPAPAPQPAPPSTPEPAVIVTRRVMMLVYDPVVDPSTGLKLSQKQNWFKAEDLSATFISDILEASGGLARYQIIQRVELDEFPAKVDGFRYTAQSYLDAYHGTAPLHKPDTVDYATLLQKYNILQRVATNEIDEVWTFGFPHAGFYESTMGGLGAFWCNSEPLKNTGNCPRRFIIMGFSLERGVGEMEEAFGHRAESIMEKVYSRHTSETNMWKRFIRYDKAFPGQSEVGNIHFAPNSDKDYDWGNQRMVASHCDDWTNYPNFKGVVRQVNCAEWGNGDIRGHHMWWLKHLPKTAGSTNGIANNWWQYIMDVNAVSA
jgi:hypothetical protein